MVGHVARFTLAFFFVLGGCLWGIELERAPAAPRLTIARNARELTVLVEGAGGGRLLIGGGQERTATLAMLGRALKPWDARVDLALVTASADLPAAIDLVRQGRVRGLALLPNVHTRPSAALSEIRAAALQHNVTVHDLSGDERFRFGRGGRLVLELVTGADRVTVLLSSDGFPMVAIGLAGPPTVTAPVVVLARSDRDIYDAAIRAEPRLLVAPGAAPGPGPVVERGPGVWLTRLLDGDTATLELTPPGVRLRGVVPEPPPGAAVSR